MDAPFTSSRSTRLPSFFLSLGFACRLRLPCLFLPLILSLASIAARLRSLLSPTRIPTLITPTRRRAGSPYQLPFAHVRRFGSAPRTQRPSPQRSLASQAGREGFQGRKEARMLACLLLAGMLSIHPSRWRCLIERQQHAVGGIHLIN